MFSIGKRCSRLSGRTKRLGKLVGEDSTDNRRTLVPGHLNPFGVMTKVIEVQSKLTVLFGADDFCETRSMKRGLTVRRKAHHLAFVAVVGKAEKLRRRGVDDAGRVRILHLAQYIDRVPFSRCPHRRDEIAKAVDRKQCGFFKRRHEERTREMRAMMFDVMKLRANVALWNAAAAARARLLRSRTFAAFPKSILDL